MRQFKQLRFLLLLGLVGLGLYLPARPVAAVTAPDVLTILNQTRANNGLHALSMNNELVVASQRHSNDMAATNNLSHTGSDGSSVGVRATQAGYSWSNIGENILYRFDASGAGAFDQWWNSPPHRDNMMSATYCDIGITYTLAGNGRYYFTMVLGKRFGQNCGQTSGGGSTGGGGYTGGGGSTGGGGALGSTALESSGSSYYTDGRINFIDIAAVVTAYCTGDGIAVYAVSPRGDGILQFSVTGAQIATGLNQAVNTRQNVELGSRNGFSLYALASNELQLNGFEPTGRLYEFVFSRNRCGDVTVTNTTPTTTTTQSTTANSTPTTTQVTSFGDGTCSHTIAAGENLYRISLRYGTTVAALSAVNGITDPTRIFVGDVLRVPC
ncbi:MAG: CAP domain-containing protein [Aggregatilineales bacterium]